MYNMKKYNIELRINSVAGKHPFKVIRELRKLLAPDGREMLSSKRFGEIRKAEVGSNTDASGEQLGIIAKYFKCKVNDLYNEKWLTSLPSLKTLNNAVQSAA